MSGTGIEGDHDKVDVIETSPSPTSIKEIRSFFDHNCFYRRFVKDFSKISNHFHKFLVKDHPFEFFDDCGVAIKELEKRLVTTPIMVVSH